MLNMFMRSEKEAPLTHEEMDTNLNNISSAVKSFGQASLANNYSPIIGYQVCNLDDGEDYIVVKAHVIGKGFMSATYKVVFDGVSYVASRVESEVPARGEPASVIIQFWDGNVAEVLLGLEYGSTDRFFSSVQKFTRSQMLMINEEAVLYEAPMQS
jgi:predicted RNase H-related nuclease YkuK (DUF458 family)